MRKERNTACTKLLVVVTLVLFMVAQHPGVLSSEEAVKATTVVKHKPLKYVVAGHRISVEAKITDPQGVSLVRCYFRVPGQSYVFVALSPGDKGIFAGTLPSPAAETKSIEYLFLAVNGKNHVVKTQTFTTDVKTAAAAPEWQQLSGDGVLALSSELPQAPAPAGFTDSVTTDVVESSARFGFVAGLYDTLQVTAAGGTTGTATGGASAGASAGATGGAVATTATGAAVAAVSAGTVSASAGVSTAVLVGAGAAVAAVGAGAAVAAEGDSESGGSEGAGGGQGSDTALDLSGSWTYTGQRDINGAFHSSLSGTASITQSGSTVTIHGIGSYTTTTGASCTEDFSQTYTLSQGLLTSAGSLSFSSNCGATNPTGQGSGTATAAQIDTRIQGTITNNNGTVYQYDVRRTYTR